LLTAKNGMVERKEMILNIPRILFRKMASQGRIFSMNAPNTLSLSSNAHDDITDSVYLRFFLALKGR
jgi:hypothetical protein